LGPNKEQILIMKVCIVTPTYNESSNIARLLQSILSTTGDVEILVVDDNSPDGTGSIVREITKKNVRVSLLSREKKDGLGKAYIAGFKEVLKNKDVDLIVMMDADFSHDPKYLPTMLKLAEEYDVVLGSRYVKGGGTVGWELWRRTLSYFGNLYARVVAGLPVHDCTGGYNAIRVSKLRQVDLDNMNVSGYAFIMGLKFLLVRTGALFVEFPIIFHNRREGESKMSAGSIARYFNEGILAPWRMRFRK